MCAAAGAVMLAMSRVTKFTTPEYLLGIVLLLLRLRQVGAWISEQQVCHQQDRAGTQWLSQALNSSRGTMCVESKAQTKRAP